VVTGKVQAKFGSNGGRYKASVYLSSKECQRRKSLVSLQWSWRPETYDKRWNLGL